MIKNKTPELMKAQGKTTLDLMYHARIALNTAKTWAEGDRSPEKIDLHVLAGICSFLGVGVGDVLEYLPPEQDN